jgi:hypothetical protein
MRAPVRLDGRTFPWEYFSSLDTSTVVRETPPPVIAPVTVYRALIHLTNFHHSQTQVLSRKLMILASTNESARVRRGREKQEVVSCERVFTMARDSSSPISTPKLLGSIETTGRVIELSSSDR